MGTRLGLALGLALTAATAVWWLGSSRIAIEGGADTSILAGHALFVLLLSRAVLIAVLGPRSAAIGGYAAGVRACVPVVSAAWPVVALAFAAGDQGAVRTLAAEAALLGGALLAPLPGLGLARVMKRGPMLETLATMAGVVLASGVWMLVSRGT
jgi:hypothetical protein